MSNITPIVSILLSATRFPAPGKKIPPDIFIYIRDRYTALLEQGVKPELVAMHASDMTTFHSMADTKIGPLFVDFDKAMEDVVVYRKQHAEALYADAQRYTVIRSRPAFLAR